MKNENARIELITVGHELLTGSTVNTNASWIGRNIARLGLILNRVSVVDDSSEEICSSLKESLSRNSSLIIFVGGLGPTHDDITLESISKCIGRKLVLNREAMEMVREYYRSKGLKVRMTAERIKMAMLPEGSVPLRNNKGTAPGVKLELEGCIIFCLPGVPREMKSIFRESVKGEIVKMAGRVQRVRRLITISGIFESTLAPFLKELQKSYPNAYIKSHPKGFEEGVSKLVLELDIRALNRSSLRNILEEIEGKVVSYVKLKGGKAEVLKQ